SLETASRSIRATAELTVRRVDPEAKSLVFDARGFEIHRLTVAGKQPNYIYDGRSIQIDATGLDAGRHVIEYSCTPRRGLSLLTLVAGKFARIEAEHDGVPLSYWVPPGREQDAARTFARTGEMLALFARVTGTPFPWNKYAQVVVSDFLFGGMENTTATTMYE